MQELNLDTQSERNNEALLAQLCDLSSSIIFFPVRHHSPVAARMVYELIESVRPDNVLIEGPSDFNPHFHELLLSHDMPIGIYSYFELENQGFRGAWYPFCDYSPEWVALRKAAEIGSDVRFIDLPWAEVAPRPQEDTNQSTHRYADAMLRRGRYLSYLCDRVGVDDFDSLWDSLFEAAEGLDLPEYFRRMHIYCMNLRSWDFEDAAENEQNAISPLDIRREAFMAQQIEQAQSNSTKTLVITGGYHSPALAARVLKMEYGGIGQERPTPNKDVDTSHIVRTGIALAPYSFDRLDSLTGYDSGMPSPGFYQHVWQLTSPRLDSDGNLGEEIHAPLITQIAASLRKRKQILSTADMIALSNTARALASLRGRSLVWRKDLTDAVISTLVKDELSYDCDSPFLDAVHEILRGEKQGKLADGVRKPPLLDDCLAQLKEFDLKPERGRKNVSLDLTREEDRAISHVLHRLKILQITGIRFDGGTDFHLRDDLVDLWEKWCVRWSPEFEASCIEASRYGTTLEAAAANKIVEMLGRIDNQSAEAAKLMIAAAQASIERLIDDILQRLIAICRQDPSFISVGFSLGDILYLYHFDECLTLTKNSRLAELLSELFARALWLLESLGQCETNLDEILKATKYLLICFEQSEDSLDVTKLQFSESLTRIVEDPHQTPTVRGAAAGMLWAIELADYQAVLQAMRAFAAPEELGDFLTGLFSLAREIAQRHTQLVSAIDELVQDFTADDFSIALPSLRLAMTYFTPREKHYLLETLFRNLGILEDASERAVQTATLIVAADEAAAAMAWEERLAMEAKKYGIRDIF